MKTCQWCMKEFLKKDKRSIFCSRSCAASFNNQKRQPMDDSQKKKISSSLKLSYKNHPRTLNAEEHSKRVGRGTRGKYKKNIKTLFDVSSRTRMKIVRRLGLCCCVCGWKEASVDIHHIIPRKKGNKCGSDNLDNLTALCPNHHRMIETGLLNETILVRLSEIITDESLKLAYYG